MSRLYRDPKSGQWLAGEQRGHQVVLTPEAPAQPPPSRFHGQPARAVEPPSRPDYSSCGADEDKPLTKAVVRLNGPIISNRSRERGISGSAFCKALAEIPLNSVYRIDVLIDSAGGDLGSAWQMVRAIEARPESVRGHVLDRAYSAGLLVLLACRRRTARPTASLMMHPPHRNGCFARSLGASTDAVFNYLAKKLPHLSRGGIMALCDADNCRGTFFTAAEAMEMKILHDVTVDRPGDRSERPTPITGPRLGDHDGTYKAPLCQCLKCQAKRLERQFGQYSPATTKATPRRREPIIVPPLPESLRRALSMIGAAQ